MSAYYLVLTDQLLCLFRSDQPVPDELFAENEEVKIRFFNSKVVAMCHIAEKISFENIFAFGAEDGIRVGQIYKKV